MMLFHRITSSSTATSAESRHRRGFRFVTCEQCEPKLCLSAIAFIPQAITPETPADGARGVYSADLDADGDMDLVSFGQDIAWYENTDGMGNFGQPRLIAPANQSWSVFAADFNQDGHLDILVGSRSCSVRQCSESVSWVENLDGKGNFGQVRNITSQTAELEHEATVVTAADFDTDGDMDVLSTFRTCGDKECVGRIAWYENVDGEGLFGKPQVIPSEAGAENVSVADFDDDGDPDIIMASEDVYDWRFSGFDPEPIYPGKLVWYENRDGRGDFGPEIVVIADHGASSIDTADMDGDGDVDLVAASAVVWQEAIVTTAIVNPGELAWYENTDGSGTFARRTIAADGAVAVHAVDMDGDGDVDIHSQRNGVHGPCSWAYCNASSWYENRNGRGSFREPSGITLIPYWGSSTHAADLDGDGDLDMFTASSYSKEVAWHENRGAMSGFGQKRIIATPEAIAVSRVYASDLDGDGDPDALAATEQGKIFWHENLNVVGQFGHQEFIDQGRGSVESVFTADVDGDGDQDILAASRRDFSGTGETGSLRWYQNTNGDGSFSDPREIGRGDFLSALAVDIDGDGDTDLLASTGTVYWYENADGKGSFIKRRISSGSRTGSGDFDGDGDRDVLTARLGEIAWLENVDGEGDFRVQDSIPTEGTARSIQAVDLDGDDDLDILARFSLRPLVWYENVDGNGSFAAEKVIETDRDSIGSFEVADFDGDGDVDILSAFCELVPTDLAPVCSYGTIWHENVDGKGDFRQQHAIFDGAQRIESLHASDLDGDGNTDFLVAFAGDDRVAWYENRVIGDADDNGQFNSSDIVKVFQIGKYEDDIPHNASFDEGDWNQDGDFDSSDLVVAFQAGHYEPAAAARIRQIAAAVDWLFAIEENLKDAPPFVP